MSQRKLERGLGFSTLHGHIAWFATAAWQHLLEFHWPAPQMPLSILTEQGKTKKKQCLESTKVGCSNSGSELSTAGFTQGPHLTNDEDVLTNF